MTQRVADVQREREEEREEEEEMILERLVAIKALRQETRRLEREYHVAGACDIAIPVGWLHLLDRGLKSAIGYAETRHAKGELSDDECREQIERAERLVAAIRDIEPGDAFSVGPEHHKALFAGLADLADLQDFDVAQLSEYNPLGQRFIATRSHTALSSLVWFLWDRVG